MQEDRDSGSLKELNRRKLGGGNIITEAGQKMP